MKKILVIDDNLANLKLALTVLEIEGYEVKTAIDAESALEIIKDYFPELILMDLQLPGMSGLELTSLLKSRPETKDIKILALTAYAMKGDEIKAINLGCDGYITKPIDTRTFPDLIARYIN